MVVGVIAPLIVAVALYGIWLGFATWNGVGTSSGTIAGLPRLREPVTIVRDDRGIPHIRAHSLHDAYFAEGYVTASDRLFQIDLTRRYVLGRLSEMLGNSTIGLDERQRIVDVSGISDAAYARLPADERDLLQAFAAGINAAAAREPTPPEYRALFFAFEPWRPQDALATGFATVLDLADGYTDVLARDTVVRAAGPQALAAWYSASDPAWDVPTVGGSPAPLPPLPALPAVRPTVGAAPLPLREDAGSNAWAAGSALTAGGRALLANDPHLRRTLPGIWYLVDIAAPGMHVAGATLAGVPGVILGHNEHLAWGATNGYTAAARVFAERFTTGDGDTYAAGSATLRAKARVETIRVRFGGDQTRRYLNTRHGFVVENSGTLRHAVQWDPVEHPRSPLDAFFALDRAASIADAERALAAYPGPVQNFVLADTSGDVAYVLAGMVPDDPAWGLRTLDGVSSPAAPLHAVPFATLPRVAPSRTATIVTANNRPYGAGYAERLAPTFAPPYRAAEIARRLHALHRYGPADFRSLQADTTSVADAELARLIVAALHRTRADADPELGPALDALSAFDGRFDPGSRGATVIQRIRGVALADLVTSHLPRFAAEAYLQNGPAFVTLMRALRQRPRGWFPNDDPDAFLAAETRAAVKRYGKDRIATAYGGAYAVVPTHPLAGFGFGFWNGPRLEGSGGSYAPAVQGPLLGQSFRAVWDVGAWDRGGIDIPDGESGEPASPHYTDLAARWPAHALTPLPFSGDAVARSARATLTLAP
jgi:penicillin amidase